MVMDDEKPTQEETQATLEDESTKEELALNEKEEKSNAKTRSTSISLSFIFNILPFSQRLQKKKVDAQFFKFLNIFKKLKINMFFVEALDQMQNS